MPFLKNVLRIRNVLVVILTPIIFLPLPLVINTQDILRTRSIIVVILAPVVFLPLPLVTNTQESKCAYIVFIMAVYWITEALPIAVTSLLPIILTPLVGLGSAKSVASRYLTDTSMLFVGGLIIAVAIEHWNIHKRLALKILLMVGTETRWLMLGLMLPTWLLSMWISNTATSAMMVPIANAILQQLKTAKQYTPREEETGNENEGLQLDELKLEERNGQQKNGDTTENSLKHAIETDDNSTSNDDAEFTRICKMMSICIAHAANVGGIGSLTGTGPNVVFKEHSDMIFSKHGGKSPVTFATWFAFGLPISALMFVLSWTWLQIYFMRRSCYKFSSGDEETRLRIKATLKKEYELLGPINFAHAAVIGHFLMLALLWITIDLNGVGWKDIFPEGTVSNSTPAILLSCSLFIFPSKIRNLSGSEPIKPLLSWKIVEKKLPWGVIILLGGGFALAFVSQEYGLSKWLGTQLAFFSYLNPAVLNMLLCIIVTAATEVTSNVAMCNLMMPIMSELALQLNVNPLYFMFPTAIASSFAFMLPVATPPNAVVFSYGYPKVLDMVKTGLMMNCIGILVLVLGTETWGEAVFNFHTLPSIFANSTIVNNTGHMSMSILRVCSV